MNFFESALVSLGQDELLNRGQEFAGEHFQPTKDPFYEKTSDGKQHRLRMPDYCTKEESKNWKSIQNKAWLHDKGLCGCCCWAENIGWAPVLAIFPIIGPALMYSVHSKLIKLADKKYNLPAEMKVKMYSNIAVDLCISLIPILGSIFAWLNACSTRNTAMIYNFVCERSLERYNNEQRSKRNREEAINNKLQNAKIINQRRGQVNQQSRNVIKSPENITTKTTVKQNQVIPDNTYYGNRIPPINNNNNSWEQQQNKNYAFQNNSKNPPYPVESYKNNNYSNNNNRIQYQQNTQQYNMVNNQHQQYYPQYNQNQNQNQYPQGQYIPMQNMQRPQRAYHS
ncbi:similar to Saccharomyces cerevisiae YLR326W Putative protein of unknown function, predicted to be palmitoylated [Maudiozyma saulgeensis]|uniref:Uncharacterized protein n=1 Tax=Maudiozyma saulgeensis TaxID=1789683 RepID=A0A1X7R9D5_9SACH|nr:similar to Saccharomyces cerevisiae YLR326W Putative protein of unknown function, predicted to be palmitoylated [Kazachstania saulgeensis]